MFSMLNLVQWRKLRVEGILEVQVLIVLSAITGGQEHNWFCVIIR